MKVIFGNLLTLAEQGHFDTIVHGCNCLNAMGRGIALTIKNQFPEAYAADCTTVRGDRNKLGTYSYATVQRNGHTFTIVNAYTQYDYRPKTSGINADYQAIQSIGMPLIGAGLAKGDWALIQHIILKELAGEDITVVVFEDQSIPTR
jgi:O-acetyl-ADP-ribose deacetylase (regulator of RNase III)